MSFFDNLVFIAYPFVLVIGDIMTSIMTSIVTVFAISRIFSFSTEYNNGGSTPQDIKTNQQLTTQKNNQLLRAIVLRFFVTFLGAFIFRDIILNLFTINLGFAQNSKLYLKTAQTLFGITLPKDKTQIALITQNQLFAHALITPVVYTYVFCRWYYYNSKLEISAISTLINTLPAWSAWATYAVETFRIMSISANQRTQLLRTVRDLGYGVSRFSDNFLTVAGTVLICHLCHSYATVVVKWINNFIAQSYYAIASETWGSVLRGEFLGSLFWGRPTQTIDKKVHNILYLSIIDNAYSYWEASFQTTSQGVIIGLISPLQKLIFL